jgi:hypothetical protein
MSLPVIAITNASTCLTDLQVFDGDSSVAATDHCGFQSLLGRGLPAGVPGQGAGTPGRMVADFRDNPDQAGALGYHELTSRRTHLEKVFSGLDVRTGVSCNVTPSHELLEMLADPWINWCAQGTDGKIYALEVCDTAESDKLGYEIDGVMVSDFITPAWFEATRADRVDFKRRIAKPLELAAGGYISVLDAAGGCTQVAARDEPSAAIPLGSRRQRRNLGKAEWRRSQHRF